MPLLARTWLLLTICLIPHGSCRWHLLSIFFNPLWLIPCQFFWWMTVLGRWVMLIVLFPFKIVVLYFFAPVSRFVRARFLGNPDSVESAIWPQELTESEDFEYAGDEEVHEMVHRIEWCDIFNAPPLISRSISMEYFQKVVKETVSIEEDLDIHECLWIGEVQEVMKQTVSTEEDEDTHGSIGTGVQEVMKEYLSSNESARIDVPAVMEELMEIENNQTATINEKFDDDGIEDEVMAESITEPVLESVNFRIDEEREEVGQFYQEYRERMAQFDSLNAAITNNLRTILTSLVGDSSLPRKFASVASTLTDNAILSEVERMKIIKSLRGQFETFYVGQCCLCSEALQFQYLRIQEMASSASPVGFPFNMIAVKFQHFRRLLERFMEDERSRGERFWNYSQFRLVSGDLLLVPSLSVDGTGGGNIEPIALLNIVEESIETFLNFLENDRKKTSLHLPKFFLLWNEAQVEDANDLEMLSNIKRSLRDKETAMKNLHAGNRLPLLKNKKRNQFLGWNRAQYLCCSIEMKLVSRVLDMPIISTDLLHWCQDILANILHEAGQLKRSRSSLLFPFPRS